VRIPKTSRKEKSRRTVVGLVRAKIDRNTMYREGVDRWTNVSPKRARKAQQTQPPKRGCWT